MSDRINFFIAGVQKAGTTALHSFLSRHPNIEMSEPKEIHFFDDETMDWASPNYDRLHSHFGWNDDRIRGEATPIYSYWPNSMERLHAYNPQAKLVVLLRHPTFRAFSHWKMEVVRKAETLSFDEAITVGRSRVTNADDNANRRFSYVERGFYAPQIERLLRLFPRESIHFAKTDDLWSDPKSTIGAVESFLGVANALEVGQEYIIAASTEAGTDLSSTSRAMLDEIYRQDIADTVALTDLDLSDWLKSHYVEELRSITE